MTRTDETPALLVRVSELETAHERAARGNGRGDDSKDGNDK